MKDKENNKIPFKILALASVVTIIFTLLWMYGTYKLGVPSYFLLFGLLIIIVAIVNLKFYMRKVNDSNLESKIAPSTLTEPTYIYGYCSTCNKPILVSREEYCEDCKKN